MSLAYKYKETAQYTYEDYKSWADEPRVELIDGVVYDMSAPTYNHQTLLLEVAFLFKGYLKGKTCSGYIAPADVRLDYDKGDKTVVQPDFFIVCDKNKIDGQNCNGSPDFILEILSPSTISKDTVVKFNKYLEAGVREYWVLDPIAKTLYVHVLDNGKYVTSAYATGEEGVKTRVRAQIFEDFEIDLAALFEEIEA